MKSLRISLLFLMLNFVFTNLALAQAYNLAPDSSTQITVTGTSTLHGWTVTAKEVQDVPTQLTFSDSMTVDSFSFGVVVNSMDGGRGASMNKKITGALKAVEQPIITFEQKEIAIVSPIDATGNFTLTSRGILKMAGLEKEVEIEVAGQKIANGIILKGSKPLTFSQFEIEPPSAMFGQIVCGDDIAVNFDFRYEK